MFSEHDLLLVWARRAVFLIIEEMGIEINATLVKIG
jgi:hypothetical protein